MVQRLKRKGVKEVAPLADARWVHGIGTICFVHKKVVASLVFGQKYVLETQFLFETKWFGDLFYSKTEGTMHDSFCCGQHVRKRISA